MSNPCWTCWACDERVFHGTPRCPKCARPRPGTLGASLAAWLAFFGILLFAGELAMTYEPGPVLEEIEPRCQERVFTRYVVVTQGWSVEAPSGARRVYPCQLRSRRREPYAARACDAGTCYESRAVFEDWCEYAYDAWALQSARDGCSAEPEVEPGTRLEQERYLLLHLRDGAQRRFWRLSDPDTTRWHVGQHVNLQ